MLLQKDQTDMNNKPEAPTPISPPASDDEALRFVMSSAGVVHQLGCSSLRAGGDGFQLRETASGPQVIDRRVSIIDLRATRRHYRPCAHCKPVVPGQRVTPRVRAKRAARLTQDDLGRVDARYGELEEFTQKPGQVIVTFTTGDVIAFRADDDLQMLCGGPGVIAPVEEAADA